MAALYRVVQSIRQNVLSVGQSRNISFSAITRLKEIIERKEGNTLYIEGVIKPDENDKMYLKPKNKACPLCSSGLDVKHTDVLILNQFITSTGNILPRRITGLCKIQQKRISSLILMAQAAGLMQKKYYKNGALQTLKPLKWKKFNTYYDEKTIKARYVLY